MDSHEPFFTFSVPPRPSTASTTNNNTGARTPLPSSSAGLHDHRGSTASSALAGGHSQSPHSYSHSLNSAHLPNARPPTSGGGSANTSGLFSFSVPTPGYATSSDASPGAQEVSTSGTVTGESRPATALVSRLSSSSLAGAAGRSPWPTTTTTTTPFAYGAPLLSPGGVPPPFGTGFSSHNTRPMTAPGAGWGANTINHGYDYTSASAGLFGESITAKTGASVAGDAQTPAASGLIGSHLPSHAYPATSQSNTHLPASSSYYGPSPPHSAAYAAASSAGASVWRPNTHAGLASAPFGAFSSAMNGADYAGASASAQSRPNTAITITGSSVNGFGAPMFTNGIMPSVFAHPGAASHYDSMGGSESSALGVVGYGVGAAYGTTGSASYGHDLPGAPRKRARRRFDEIERLYDCSYPGCTKAYGTLNHLNAHITMQKHGPKRLPLEFKEARKEWRARKKAEAEQRKASQSHGSSSLHATSTSAATSAAAVTAAVAAATTTAPGVASLTIPHSSMYSGGGASSTSPFVPLALSISPRSSPQFAHPFSHSISPHHQHSSHPLISPSLQRPSTGIVPYSSSQTASTVDNGPSSSSSLQSHQSIYMPSTPHSVGEDSNSSSHRPQTAPSGHGSFQGQHHQHHASVGYSSGTALGDASSHYHQQSPQQYFSRMNQSTATSNNTHASAAGTGTASGGGGGGEFSFRPPSSSNNTTPTSHKWNSSYNLGSQAVDA